MGYSDQPLIRILEEAWFCESRALRMHQRIDSPLTWEWVMYLRERRMKLEEDVKARYGTHVAWQMPKED